MCKRESKWQWEEIMSPKSKDWVEGAEVGSHIRKEVEGRPCWRQEEGRAGGVLPFSQAVGFCFSRNCIPLMNTATMDINPSTNPEHAHLPLTRLSPIHWFEILQFSAVHFNINPDHPDFHVTPLQFFSSLSAFCVWKIHMCWRGRLPRVRGGTWGQAFSELSHKAALECESLGTWPCVLWRIPSPLCDWFVLGEGQPSSPLLYIRHSTRLL